MDKWILYNRAKSIIGLGGLAFFVFVIVPLFLILPVTLLVGFVYLFLWLGVWSFLASRHAKFSEKHINEGRCPRMPLEHKVSLNSAGELLCAACGVVYLCNGTREKIEAEQLGADTK